MALYQAGGRDPLFDSNTQAVIERRGKELAGIAFLLAALIMALMLGSYLPEDPSWLSVTDAPVNNIFGRFGASIAAPLMIIVGLASWTAVLTCAAWGVRFLMHRGADRILSRIVFAPIAIALVAIYASSYEPSSLQSYGGLFGDTVLAALTQILPFSPVLGFKIIAFMAFFAALAMVLFVCGFTRQELTLSGRSLMLALVSFYAIALHLLGRTARSSVAATQRYAHASAMRREERRAQTAELHAYAEAEQFVPTRVIRAVEVDDAVLEDVAPEPMYEAAPTLAAPTLAAPVLAAPAAPAPVEKPTLFAKVPALLKRAPEETFERIEPELVEPALAPEPDLGGSFDERIRNKISNVVNARARAGSRAVTDGERIEPPMSAAQLAAAKYKKGPKPIVYAQTESVAESVAAPVMTAASVAEATPVAPISVPAPEVAASAMVEPTFRHVAVKPIMQEAAPQDAAIQEPVLHTPVAPEAASHEPAAVVADAPEMHVDTAGPEVSAPQAYEVAPEVASVAAKPSEYAVRPVRPERVEPPVSAAPVSPVIPAAPAMSATPTMPAVSAPAAAEAAAPLDTPEYVAADAARFEPAVVPVPEAKHVVEHPVRKPVAQSKQAQAEAQPTLKFDPTEAEYKTPPLSLLESPSTVERHALPDEALEENARMLEAVLDDYGVKGEIVSVRPGPVVTMYELEPAPGLKASRVIGLAEDIARSMSALSARVSTVPGRTVIGIELPNENREKVVLREILAARDFGDSSMKLPLALGKDIGGDPIVANLAKMPHLLIAGTTGSGKSVAINTMILSLLYKLTPSECRMIMIDPKMLELSVYDGIPHLLSPVVTDPKKAVVALKWTVSEMEDRYRKMSKMGVRNIDGYNDRVKDTLAKGEMFSRTVQTGFDDETGDPIFETEEFQPETLPYIVVVVDEMADLMMVAGKEIEACIQRLAQMARASGIHIIMATQRPSVDVITGTIKANFPTRISFQVSSKIDSRTILGEQGAEQLLGMGDMLYMAGGSKITRVHGPFCSDEEVEKIVSYLKSYGPPSYIGGVVEGPPSDKESSIDAVLGLSGGNTDSEDALYDTAVAIVLKDRKCSTSYIQRKLAIGYNKAARLVEQMEDERVVSAANHVGKREILVPEQ